MCGLVASFSLEDTGFSVDEYNMFEGSMIFNQMRGDDSTGVVCIDKEDGWSYLKDIGGWKNLTKQREWDDMRRRILNRGRLAFGHGRAATRGNVTLENAHPFAVKKNDNDEKHTIVFVHNGTLEYFQDLPGMQSFDVDSHWLAKMIAVHGAEKALGEIKGAAACMWWNVPDLKFYFYRNSERPLYWMNDKKGRFWLNSEKSTLEYMNYRFGLKIPDKNIYMVKEDILYSVQANGDKLGKIEDVKIKKVVRPVVRHHSSAGMYVNGFLCDDDLDDYRIWWEGAVGAKGTELSPSPWLPAEDKNFWDRSIETIEWINGDKVITYRTRAITRIKGVEPPEECLVRMYEVKTDGNVMKVYNYKGQQPTYVKISFDDWKKERDKNKSPEEKDPRTKNINDGVVRWTTRLVPSNKKVKHRGEIHEGATYPHMKTYSNTEDGWVTLGEEVTIELLWIENASTNSPKTLKVYGGRVKEKPDHYIDYRFFSYTMSKEELSHKRFFRGKVATIRAKSIDEMRENETGAQVIVTLVDVFPIEEPKAASAVAVVETKETQNETKTVH